MSAIDFLDSTVAARWRTDLIGHGPHERRHWRTKQAHYEAVDALLRRGPKQALRWEQVVEAVQPKGSRSTFYDVTGANATHALIARYLAARNLDCTQIAFRYRRASAVDQLVDETKVWSYWPYRERWLALRRDQTVDGAMLAESLKGVVGNWARRHPELAAAVGHAPPACAVEDLTLVLGGQLLALRAFDALVAVVVEAIQDHPPRGADIMSSSRGLSSDALRVGLVETMYALGPVLR